MKSGAILRHLYGTTPMHFEYSDKVKSWQQTIAAFKRDEYGEPLFFPDAIPR